MKVILMTSFFWTKENRVVKVDQATLTNFSLFPWIKNNIIIRIESNFNMLTYRY